MATNKLSTLWTNFTTDIISISVPLVAWETRIKEIFQLTPEDLSGSTPVSATFRTWVNPVDLNDKGAAERDVEVGYGFMSYFGDVYSIIAVNDDGSIDISDILLCGYCPPSGRPAMIYSLIATVPVPKPPIVTHTDWVDVVSCVKDGDDNTGLEVGYRKKIQKNEATGLWEDTGEQEPISRINYGACPLPEPPAPDPYRAGQYTGMTFNPSSVSDFSFSFGVDKTIKTPGGISGRNYLFLSIPDGKTFKVLNGGDDITSKFGTSPVGTDNKIDYQNNNVWKKTPPYASEDIVPFSITIYN